jgi:hypothetical protein
MSKKELFIRKRSYMSDGTPKMEAPSASRPMEVKPTPQLQSAEQVQQFLQSTQKEVPLGQAPVPVAAPETLPPPTLAPAPVEVAVNPAAQDKEADVANILSEVLLSSQVKLSPEQLAGITRGVKSPNKPGVIEVYESAAAYFRDQGDYTKAYAFLEHAEKLAKDEKAGIAPATGPIPLAPEQPAS